MNKTEAIRMMLDGKKITYNLGKSFVYLCFDTDYQVFIKKFKGESTEVVDINKEEGYGYKEYKEPRQYFDIHAASKEHKNISYVFNCEDYPLDEDVMVGSYQSCFYFYHIYSGTKATLSIDQINSTKWYSKKSEGVINEIKTI